VGFWLRGLALCLSTFSKGCLPFFLNFAFFPHHRELDEIKTPIGVVPHSELRRDAACCQFSRALLFITSVRPAPLQPAEDLPGKSFRNACSFAFLRRLSPVGACLQQSSSLFLFFFSFCFSFFFVCFFFFFFSFFFS